MSLAARHRIAAVAIDSASDLHLDWADGHHSRFPAVWLLAACDCERCGSSETAVRHARLTELPERPRIIEAACDDAGDLTLNWGGGHQSHFDPGWLRAHCLSPEERAWRLVTPRPWGREMADSLPLMDYEEVRGTPALHLAFLERLRDLGFVILRGVPAERERTPEITGLVGHRRDTNYGIFELKSKPDPEIVGDMALALDLHTDEPYRRDPPAITFFHVLQQNPEGGDSTLADGFYVAERLRDLDPDAFDLLASTPARFHRRLKEGRSFEMQAPILSVDSDGCVIGVRLLDRGLAPVDLPPDAVVPFYRALKMLLSLLYAGEGMITVKLQPGEMLIFNNQRLLHGRTAFDPANGPRHVRSCHVDLDEFHSKLRTLYRAHGREEAWMRFRRGVIY